MEQRPTPKRVIIAGSRDISTYVDVETAMARLVSPVAEVVSGTARGVDQLGEQWAHRHNIPVKRFPANWAQHGRRAGMLRNAEMAEYADGLVAVWDGQSPGTANMIRTMRHLGKPVFIYRPGNNKTP